MADFLAMKKKVVLLESEQKYPTLSRSKTNKIRLEKTRTFFNSGQTVPERTYNPITVTGLLAMFTSQPVNTKR